MLLALALSVQLLAAVQSDDSTARVQHLNQEPPPSAAPSAAQAQGASLAAGPTTRRKSTNFLIALGELGAGAITGYLGLALGILVNVPRGGLSDPLGIDDVFLTMVLPATVAAAFAWLVGLFDAEQRTIIGSAIWALLGAGAGELLGVGGGVLVGRSLYPHDVGAQGIVMIAAGPAVAALFAMLFMELFKPGEELGAYASLSVARTHSGALVVGPAVGWRF